MAQSTSQKKTPKKTVTKYKMSTADKFVFAWFVFNVFIHCGLEGYYITDCGNILKGTDNFWSTSLLKYFPSDSTMSFVSKLRASYVAFGRALWKEYSNGDFRYALCDPFIVAVETVTAVALTPLCVWVAFLIRQKPTATRYLLQFFISVCQMYGLTLYYYTEYLQGLVHINPSNWFRNFWLYFFGANFFWYAAPLVVAIQAAGRLVNMEEKSRRS